MDRILLVEDESTLRNSLCRVLRAEKDLDPYGVGLLADALRAVDEQLPGLIVADLDLPDGCGMALLDELSKRHKDVPIIFMTGQLARFQAELSRNSRVSVLEKPFEPAVLTRLIRKRLARDSSGPAPDSVFTVADYLQLAGLARRSVVLGISDAAGGSGRIVIMDGTPIWAQDRLGTGLDAFRRMAMLPRTDVAARPCPEWPHPPNLEGSLEGLLLAAATLADEASREQARAARRRAAANPQPSDSGQRMGAPSSVRPALSAQPSAPPGRGLRPPTASLPTPTVSLPPSGNRPAQVSAQMGVPLTDAVSPSTQPSAPSALAAAPSLIKPPSERLAPPPLVRGRFASNTTLRTVPRPHTEKDDHVKSQAVPIAPAGVKVEQILALSPALKAVATADSDGSVLSLTGDIDAETLCAVAVMASRHVVELSEELGLGEPRSWHVSIGESTWYVVSSGDGLVIARSELTKNATTVLSKVETFCWSAA